MSQHSAAPVVGATLPINPLPTNPLPTISLRELAPWALFFGMLGLLVIFFISADQGAVSIPSGTLVHEWVHDGRHLLGYPCH